ncbi:hypothetical protein K8I31_00010 [bacterium]|nr:hypothetical protein [bacterium]
MDNNYDQIIQELESSFDSEAVERIEQSVDLIVAAKEKHKKVVVVTGSGPNLHEGVTTLIAELMRIGVIDGVTTSSAVIAHEMGGTLDKVKRCNGEDVGVDKSLLPLGGDFELTEMDDELLESIESYMPIDRDLIERIKYAEGKTIIKAAGNLGYPVGFWLERLSMEIMTMARLHGLSFEETAGYGADSRTMIGIGAQKNLPVIVTIPQLVGGGLVGLCIGDSISIHERANRIANLLNSADVIIESGVALTQEIHDGPLERYTGHGLWSAWQGHSTYSLEGKTIIRIDLDRNLNQVWEIEKKNEKVQKAIADGQPKTKLFEVPFRMEMSGFARLPGSLPVIGDLGLVWPSIARRVVKRLGLKLEFFSYPQQSKYGQDMREWIVNEVQPLKWERLQKSL